MRWILPRWDRDDRGTLLASRLGEGKDHHQEREQRLRPQVTLIDPEPVVLIGNRDKGIFRFLG